MHISTVGIHSLVGSFSILHFFGLSNDEFMECFHFDNHSKSRLFSHSINTNKHIGIRKKYLQINVFCFFFVIFFYSLIMQPHILNGTNNGHVVIDIVKDANAKDWPPIVLDINNITITRAQGKYCNLSYSL